MKLPGMAEEMNQHQQASLTDWRAAVRTEVQRLREHVGAEQIVLVGHSTGGALAVDFVQSGGEAAGVVCVAPAFGVSNVRSPVLTSRAMVHRAAAAAALYRHARARVPPYNSTAQTSPC